MTNERKGINHPVSWLLRIRDPVSIGYLEPHQCPISPFNVCAFPMKHLVCTIILIITNLFYCLLNDGLNIYYYHILTTRFEQII